MDSGPYLSSLEILSGDFRRLTEFVEPVDANLSTYSYRLYELLLRACTDFESVCKEKLVADGYVKPPADMNINDYKTLETSLGLEQIEVGILIWRPSTSYVRPFSDWSTMNPPLSWYRDYNQVKHNRNTRFSLANLENVCLALAGLFALLAQLKILPILTGHKELNTINFKEVLYVRQIFSVRYPV